MEVGPGAEIAGYRLEEVIGEGGMGVVYRARQLDLDRPVALKLILATHRGDPEFKQRFQRESQLAAAIDHPNVVPIFQAGEANGHLYIAMRYVAGTDLAELLAVEAPLSPTRAARLATEIAGGLDAAHEAGLVHRDIKPANVLLDSSEHVYLTDFGLTKQVDSRSQHTQTGLWFGALPYAAPEQIESKPLDARADIYALGCVLFEALTGRRPYERDNDMAVMWAKVHEDAPLPSSLNPGLPPEFDDVLAKAITRRPADRFASAGDLARAAEGAASGRTEVEPERTVARGAAAGHPTVPLPSPEGPRRSSRLPRWLLPVGGAVAALLLGAIAAFAISSGGNSGEPEVRTLSTTVTESEPETGLPASAAQEEAADSSASLEQPDFESVNGDFGFAEVPAGWIHEKQNERVGPRIVNQWRNPSSSETSVLIDAQSHHGNSTAFEDAETVRAETSQTPGYREISFEPVSLSGLPAARWVFDVEGDRRVDYFVVNCEVGYAVLGSALPSEFGGWAPAFHRVASSIEPFCD